MKRKDEEKHGHYRTKDTILQIYDALAKSQRTGQPYATRLDPYLRAAELKLALYGRSDWRSNRRIHCKKGSESNRHWLLTSAVRSPGSIPAGRGGLLSILTGLTGRTGFLRHVTFSPLGATDVVIR